MLTKGFAIGLRALRMGFILFAAMVVVSCGGGGSSTPSADPTGYYGVIGTMTTIDNETSMSVTSSMTQGIAENNQILIFSSDGKFLFDIHVSSITGNNFTGTAKAFEMSGSQQVTADLKVTGTITQGSSIKGTLSGTAAFGQGTFSLIYNNQMGAIPALASNWKFTDTNFSNNIDFSTDGTGAIASGPTAPTGFFANCSVNPVGITTEIGSSKIYKVALTLGGATCGVAGDYTGYVVAQDAAPTALAMALVIKDGSKAFGASFVLEP